MTPDECASRRSIARWVLPVLVGPSTAVTPLPGARSCARSKGEAAERGEKAIRYCEFVCRLCQRKCRARWEPILRFMRLRPRPPVSHCNAYRIAPQASERLKNE